MLSIVMGFLGLALVMIAPNLVVTAETEPDAPEAVELPAHVGSGTPAGALPNDELR